MSGEFPSNFASRILEELPGHRDAPHYFYPGATTLGGRDGLVVFVEPRVGQPWLGTFAFGAFGSKGLSGMFPAPDPDKLCVVARGAGYLVVADRPAVWEAINVNPIVDVKLVPSHRLLIFSDFTKLVAYDSQGIKWITGRLAWDGFRVTKVTDATIEGEFLDIRTEACSSFSVDLQTGQHQGGIGG